MDKEKRIIFITDILNSTASVYFSTFFVLYFFNVANYEIIPLAKYYITTYLFIGIAFILISKLIKNNYKVESFRIGIALRALYVALIMFLKENIINYIFLVAIIDGLSQGFYSYPKNLLNTEKITNEDRQKYSSTINTVCQFISILIPLLLGILLTYFSYIEVGKAFFALYVAMYLISFKLKDGKHNKKKMEFKKFYKLIKTDKYLKYALLKPFLSGLTISSGVMYLIINLYKIYNFKTNLNLGFVTSICSFICLVACFIFKFIKKKKFSKVMIFSGIISFITILLFTFIPSRTSLIVFMLIDNLIITFIALISNMTVTNYSNKEEIKKDLKPEFYLIIDVMFMISRVLGYTLLLLVCLFIGKEYINYLMIVPAISLILESIMIGKLNKENS